MKWILVGAVTLTLAFLFAITLVTMLLHRNHSEYIGFKWVRKLLDKTFIVLGKFKNFFKSFAKIKKIFKRNIFKRKFFKLNPAFRKTFKTFFKILFAPFIFPWRLINRIKWKIKKSRNFKYKKQRRTLLKRFINWLKNLFSKKHTKENIMQALINDEEINESYGILKIINVYKWDEVLLSDIVPLFTLHQKDIEKELKKAKIELVSVLEKWVDQDSQHNLELNKDYVIKKFNEKNIFFWYIKSKVEINKNMPVFKNVNIRKDSIGYRLEVIKNEHIWTQEKRKTSFNNQTNGSV